MEYESQLTEGVFLSRERQVLVKVAISKEVRHTIYCPTLLQIPDWQLLGSRVWFSSADHPHCKYPYTWELMEVSNGDLLHINVAATTDLLIEGIEQQIVSELTGYGQIYKEVAIGSEGMRANLILEGDDQKRANYQACPLTVPYQTPSENCVVMIENVMLYDEIQRAFFPDIANIEKKQKLKSLIAARAMGYRAVLFCSAQHSRIRSVCLADHIDKAYGQLLRQALQAGVEIYSYGLDISLTNISFNKPLPLIIPRFALS